MELRKTTGGNNRFKAIHPIPVSDEAIQQAMDALENHESDTIQAICDLLARSKQWPVKEMNKAPNVDPERVIQMTSDGTIRFHCLVCIGRSELAFKPLQRSTTSFHMTMIFNSGKSCQILMDRKRNLGVTVMTA
jgi:hypothetical protein